VKVTTEHRDMIEDAIARMLVRTEREKGLTEADVRARYVARDIPRGDAVQDIDKRYRWDLFHAATAGTRMGSDLYAAGYHDAHLDTALRSIVSPLESATATG
jgi:hypothetical protein